MKEYNEALRLRINELLDRTNDNANSISSNQAQQRRISRQLNEGKDFTVPTIIDILVKYPEVSADWLLTGEGSKYKPISELSSVDTTSEKSINDSAELAKMTRKYNEATEMIEQLKKKCELLEKALEEERKDKERAIAQLDYASDILRERLIAIEHAQKVG